MPGERRRPTIRPLVRTLDETNTVRRAQPTIVQMPIDPRRPPPSVRDIDPEVMPPSEFPVAAEILRRDLRGHSQYLQERAELERRHSGRFRGYRLSVDVPGPTDARADWGPPDIVIERDPPHFEWDAPMVNEGGARNAVFFTFRHQKCEVVLRTNGEGPFLLVRSRRGTNSCSLLTLVWASLVVQGGIQRCTRVVLKRLGFREQRFAHGFKKVMAPGGGYMIAEVKDFPA